MEGSDGAQRERQRQRHHRRAKQLEALPKQIHGVAFRRRPVHTESAPPPHHRRVGRAACIWRVGRAGGPQVRAAIGIDVQPCSGTIGVLITALYHRCVRDLYTLV